MNVQMCVAVLFPLPALWQFICWSHKQKSAPFIIISFHKANWLIKDGSRVHFVISDRLYENTLPFTPSDFFFFFLVPYFYPSLSYTYKHWLINAIAWFLIIYNEEYKQIIKPYHDNTRSLCLFHLTVPTCCNFKCIWVMTHTIWNG